MTDLIMTSQKIQEISKMDDFTTIFDCEEPHPFPHVVRQVSTLSCDEGDEEGSIQTINEKGDYSSSCSDESSSYGSQMGGNCDDLTSPPHQSVIDKNGDEPTNDDVVCGRNKFSHAHVGNKRFRVLIEMHRKQYQTAPSRCAKTRIAIEFVAMIRKCGGRFLTFDTGTNKWCDVGDERAREKVSHALRSAKDPAQKKARRKRRPSQKKKLERSTDKDEVFQNLLVEQRRIFEHLIKLDRLRRDETRSRREL